MNINRRLRRQLWLHNGLFYLLLLSFVGVLGYLSQQYAWVSDWTHGARNTLSDSTLALLNGMPEPMQVTAYVEDLPELREHIKTRLKPYQHAKRNLQLEFVNPDLNPSRAQADGVTAAGQMVWRYGSRHEVLNDVGLPEGKIASALQRLNRESDEYVVFIEGHGERDPRDRSGSGYQQITQYLQRSGLNLQTLNFVRSPYIPDNTAFLVIASPTSAWNPGAVTLVRDYLAAGGNLLWLMDPGDELFGLEPLAADLGIRRIKGTIVDANQELRMLMGLQHPAIVPVVDYGNHPIMQDLRVQTLFPFAGGLLAMPDDGWNSSMLMKTLPQSWSETSPLEGDGVRYDEDSGDQAGPIPLAFALERREDDHNQRVVVIGDADFLSNTYLGRAGNLDFTNAVFNWLAKDDALMHIAPKYAPDTELELGSNTAIALALLFMLVVPLGLIGSGLWIWMRRRRR